jgi:hypothetical protein
MAEDRETPLTALFAGAIRLAYPARADDEVRLAVLRYERYLADPPRGVDKFGNPLWMRLAPSGSDVERQGWGTSSEAPRGQADHAEEDESPALGTPKRHFIGKFFSQPKNFEKERIEESRARRPLGDAVRNSMPVRMIRAAVFVTLFAVLYYCFTAIF